MKIFTKESLVDELKKIQSKAWIPSIRPSNSGGIRNTLESLLGIEENNLPLPNASEWELKTQRIQTNSLITLFHLEPSPTSFRFVPQILLPCYGWLHPHAGRKYPENEMSFRQTISCRQPSDRGFAVWLNDNLQRVEITFDAGRVAAKHQPWLDSVEQRIGLGELSPQPYWGYDDLFFKAGTKLHNTFLSK